MSLNLNLLIKLCKLANNNPNNNEANLAARKVCKLIGENEYKLIEPVDNKEFGIPKPVYTRPSSINYEDFIKHYTSIFKERPIRRPYTEYKSPEHNRDFDPFKDMRNEYKPTTRTLKCNDCKEDKDTIFVGHPSAFVCNDCIGKYK